MGSNAKGALFALLAFGVYATHDAVVKYLGGSYSSFQIVFFFVLFSFPLAVLTIIGDPKPGTLMPVHPRWVAVRTVAAMTSGISAFYAFTALPMAQAYAILFATPLMKTLPEAVQESLAKSIPFPQRLGKPEEFAQLAAHIVTNSHLNGEVIRLDGALRLAPR